MSTRPYEQAIEAARGALANVSADQMGNQTPCASWDVSALINHMVSVQYFMEGGMNGTPPRGQDIDYASGDYIAAFDEAASATLAAFGADGALEKMVTLPFGEMPGGAFMGIATNDTFTHAWDLAKATDQSTDLDPEFAAGLLAQAQMVISDDFRGPEGAPFGSEQQAPEGAGPADQLAAFLGRSV